MSQPSPLSAAQHRAQALRDAGDAPAAARLLTQALEALRPAYGEDHPEVLATAYQLARLHREADEPAAARRVLEEALAAGQRRWGDADPLMLAISFDLGAVAEELGNRHEARRNFTRVATLGPAVLGADHWSVRAACEYLGISPPAAPAPQQPEPQPAPQHQLPPYQPVSATPDPLAHQPAGTVPPAPVAPPPVPPPAPEAPYGTVAAAAAPAGPAAAPAPATPSVPATPPQQQAVPATSAPIGDQAGPAVPEAVVPDPSPVAPPAASPAASPVDQPTEQSAPNRPASVHPALTSQPGTYPVVTRSPGPRSSSSVPAATMTPASPSVAHPPVDTGRVSQGRGYGVVAVAALAAAVAVIAAVVVVVVTLVGGAEPPASPVPSVAATAAGDPPTDLKLRDDGATITITWTDPSAGTVPFVVAGGRAGQTLSAMASVDPGTTRYTVNGLNPRLDYCFTVLAVYSTETYATSGQVCTNRNGASPTPD